MALLIDGLHEAVVHDALKPLLSKEQGQRVIRLGLARDGDFCLALIQERGIGADLWIEIEDDAGRRVDSWSAREVGVERVSALWALCRAKLYGARTEEAIASLGEWLRQHRANHEEG